MKLFLDTNIFIRYLVPENQTIYAECTKLITLIQKGTIIPYVTNVVFQEILYVLTKQYKFTKKEVVIDIFKLFKLRNLILIEKTNTPQAILLYRDRNIKYADCLIATQIPKGVTLCTYDTEFKHLPSLSVATPAQILTRLN